MVSVSLATQVISRDYVNDVADAEALYAFVCSFAYFLVLLVGFFLDKMDFPIHVLGKQIQLLR